jgi:hypothetical protein
MEMCQHNLAISQVRFVDPSFLTLGDLGQHSVSVDICRAAYKRGFPHQITLSRIFEFEI